MTLDVDQLLGYLAQLVIILGGIGGGYLAVKKWVKSVSKNAEKAAHQLETSNGKTVGEYVEEMAKAIPELQGIARDNRTRIELLETRFDSHLKGHP